MAILIVASGRDKEKSHNLLCASGMQNLCDKNLRPVTAIRVAEKKKMEIWLQVATPESLRTNLEWSPYGFSSVGCNS